jgi:PAS domain-containing protein
MPSASSQVEEAMLALAGHVFLPTPHASVCLDALERLLGAVRLEYLLLFLAFVRAAHYCTKVHPEIEFEDDIKQLLAAHEALANCILSDSDAPSDSVSQSLWDELPSLRQKADKAIALLAAIVESSDDAIISKTLDGSSRAGTRVPERLFGYTAEKPSVSISSSFRSIADRETIILERLTRGEPIRSFRYCPCTQRRHHP